jgi:peptidoglycan/xylan/chitin deacetylase (PgdA/CDA1 family)
MRFIAEKIMVCIPSSAILLFHHITDIPRIFNSGCLLSSLKFTDLIYKFTRFGTIYEVLKTPWKRKIAISFDDGLEDIYTIAYPILKERRIPFTIFVITDFLDSPGYITAEQLKILAKDSLVTIGSHGITHKNLPDLSIEQQKSEIYDSKKILEGIINKNVDLFAYSHGLFDKTSLTLASVYRYCFSVTPLPLNFITALFRRRIPRFNIQNETFDMYLNTIKNILNLL